jgi:hypothetical protein
MLQTHIKVPGVPRGAVQRIPIGLDAFGSVGVYVQ